MFVLLCMFFSSQAQFVEYSQFQMAPSDLNPRSQELRMVHESPFSIAINGPSAQVEEQTAGLRVII